MATERDLAVAQLCLERGYATPAQVEECLRETSSGEHTFRPLEAVLRRRGYISEDVYRELSRQDRRMATPPPRLPAEVEQAAADPARRFGKYILVRELGAGGMGVVYQAYETELRRTVALKFIRGVEAERDLERFLREAQLAATLSHPGIAPIYESGVHEGKHYFAMQFVEGRTLDQVLAAEERPSVRRGVEILAAVADAVEYAHEHGIIHRDLKPANVMVDARGRAFVMDFGLAKSVRAGSSLTGSGLTVGTPAYMSPEQAQGDPARIGPRTDVYALGACLYQLATGKPPFDGENVVELLVDVVHRDPVPPRRANPKFPVDLETIALKALDKDPDRRYASAAEFAAELRRWMEGEPILARPAGPLSRFAKRVRKQRTAAAGALALVLGLAVGGGILAARMREKSARSLALPAYEEAARAFGEADRVRFMPAGSTGHYVALLDRAEEHARKAAALDPSYADAHFLLGRTLALRRPGDPESIDCYTRAIDAEPGHLRARLERGLARLSAFYDRYGLDSLSSRLGQDAPVLNFKEPDADFEARRSRVVEDLRAVASAGDYERELAAGATELAGWRPGDDARLGRAEERLARAAAAGPNETAPLRLLATARLCRGDKEGAADRMMQAVRLAPNDPVVLHAACIPLVFARRLDEALEVSGRAIALSPRNPGLLNIRANVRMHRGDLEGALEDFRRASEIDPKSPLPHGNAGYAYFSAGRFGDALRSYDEALARSPGQADYLEARGLVLLQLGRLEEAEAELDRLVAARPDAGAYSNRGVVRVRRERFKEAEADYRESLRLAPDDGNTAFNFGVLRQRQGDHAAAAELYREAIRKGRKRADSWSALEKALVKLKRWAEVESACGDGLKEFPDDAVLHWDRALARAEQGNAEGALEDYRKALALKPGEAGLERDVGVTLAKLGRMEEAIAPLERAVAGGRADIAPLLGTCLMNQGKLDEARAAYDRGVAALPKDPMAWFGRAQLLHRMGKPAEALADLDRAVGLRPEFAEAVGFRGVVKLDLKQTRGAADDLRRAIELKPALQGTFEPFLEKTRED
jgi:tetratricopeptide (TPR) repeat protein/predicted Ser/Thr protein kinase